MDYGKPDNLLRKNVKNQKWKVIEVLVEPYFKRCLSLFIWAFCEDPRAIPQIFQEFPELFLKFSRMSQNNKICSEPFLNFKGISKTIPKIFRETPKQFPIFWSISQNHS